MRSALLTHFTLILSPSTTTLSCTNSYDAMAMEILCNKDPMMYLPQAESL